MEKVIYCFGSRIFGGLQCSTCNETARANGEVSVLSAAYQAQDGFAMVDHLLISESDYEFENELETSWKTANGDIFRTLT